MHHPQGAAIIVFIIDKDITKYKTIHQTARAEKATLRETCAQSMARDADTSGIRFFHLCVHITKACGHAEDRAACRAENISITTVW